MSYDIAFEISTGGESTVSAADFNHTYNCSPMFNRALEGKGIRDLNGQRAGDAAEKLWLAWLHMDRYPALYRIMEPENGWGSYDTAKTLLKLLHQAAVKHPDTTIVIR